MIYKFANSAINLTHVQYVEKSESEVSGYHIRITFVSGDSRLVENLTEAKQDELYEGLVELLEITYPEPGDTQQESID